MTGTRITRVNTIAVHVSDVERALAFYVGTLGFEVRLDATYSGGQRWTEVAPAGATTTIAVIAAPPGVAVGIDTGLRFATEDAKADHADLQAAGADVDPEVFQYPGTPPMFTLRDPDGNQLYLVETASR